MAQLRHLIIVGGTWEQKWGMLAAVANHPAVQQRWGVRWLDYPAAYGTPESIDDSLATGVVDLQLMLRGLPADKSSIAVLGFSQGAMLVEKSLRDIQWRGGLTNQAILQRIKYVGLLGNPYRAAGDQIGPDPGGYGIAGPIAPAGQVPIARSSAWENFALPGDLIAACPADSLIRLIYPFTRAMSAQHPDVWARDVAAKLSVAWVWRHLPEVRSVRTLPSLVRQIVIDGRAAQFYLTSGIHGQYPVRRLSERFPTPTGAIVRSLGELE